ncbi:ABC transporter substrate-binding protein [Sellimonas caecigallum]|uniref:ABC transporter substrate-binding protein n=2 Tax=Lachnospiraceae TaxID=186803 RepID=A0ABS7L6P6_9FIRM|nr:ABC transporter substrate-binding protein [Sellimonas caecigallum]MBY0758731.1 ABC transporter substrate-binding protein [Sellimonas caecigallum]
MKMRKKIWSCVTALVLCTALFVSGCGGSNTEKKDTEKGADAKKEELHIAISANPPSLDPQSVNSNIVGGIGIHIYEPLFAMNANYEPTPVLAESYEVSKDGKEYTIKLRQGVKFHNGKEMTADDVVASMNRWVEVSAKANTLIGGSVFEKVDDYTVKLTVNEPASDIIMILAGPIQFAAIYPKEVVESATAEGISEYIGTGPYKVSEWKQDQYVELERYDEYQPAEGEASGLAGKKEAATKTIVYDVVTDASTRIAGVQSGQYDIAEEIPLDNYEELAKDTSLKLNVDKGGTLNLFLDTTEGIMANQKVREAALAALNCEDIMLAAYGNPELYELNNSWMDPTDTQWGTDAGKEFYSQNDTEKAKELLAESGYNNEKIVLVTTPDYAEMYNATLVVQEQLKKAGFNAEVESYDFSTFMEHRADPNQFDMFITSNSYNMLPIQLSVLDSGWAGLDRPEVSEGISKIRGAASDEEAAAAWGDIQTFLYEYGAATVLGHYTGVSAMDGGVEGVDYLRFNIYWGASAAE